MNKKEERRERSNALWVKFEQLVCDHQLNNRPLNKGRAHDYAINILLDRQIDPLLVARVRRGVAGLLQKRRYSVRVGFHRHEAFRILYEDGIPEDDLQEFCEKFEEITARRGVIRENGFFYFTGDIKVDVSEDSAAELRRQRLAENLLRQDVDPVSEGKAYQEMVALDGYTVAGLAKLYSVAESTVQDRMNLLNLPQDIQDQVRSGKLSLTRLYADWNLETGKLKERRRESILRPRGKREINRAIQNENHPIFQGLDSKQVELVKKTLRWARGEEI